MNAKSDNATAPKWVAYYRVSTKKQSIGLEAQRAKVEAAAASAGAVIIDEVEEKESGKECQRPGLNKAMAIARRNGAVLVVAKYDRLSRDLAYAAELVFKSGLEFNILGMPEEAMTNHLMFGVYYGLAAQEAQLISERTKAAMAAKRAQGVKFGRPNAAITAEMRRASAEVRIRKADENTNNVAAAGAIRRYLNTDGKRTLQAIADHLNAHGFYTASGVFHTPQSIKLLCVRYGIERKS